MDALDRAARRPGLPGPLAADLAWPDVRTWPRRLVGAALLLLALVPVYGWLAVPETGLAGEATAAAAATTAALAWGGTLLLAIPALVAARLIPVVRLERGIARAARVVARAPVRVCATASALVALSLTLAFERFVLNGQPMLVDAMSQLLHARWLAAGQWAGPDAELGAFVNLQQSLFTEHGWVSQYPPGFVVLLALGFLAGAVWLVGPVLLAATAVLTMLAADRLLPGRRAEARLGAGLVAVSPFLVAQAGAYMSHAAAAALGAAAIWAATHVASGGRRWAWLAGAALGALFATRPLTALAIGVLVGILVLARPTRLGWFVLGGAPFVLGVALWNAHLFGGPATWGYTAALGPAAGPGFGIDPWGNVYGPAQALAYTSAELTALSVFLFEAPLPVVGLIGLAILIAPRMAAGERVILAWAVLPLAANLLYWHHGLFMGPRMLADAAPAWSLLAVLSVVALVRRVPATAGAWSPRVFATTLAAGGLVAGLAWLGPARLMSYALPPAEALAAASPAAASPALVFVHGGWTSRVAMRLAAAGMRLDSVETALRQNTTCAVEQWVTAREAGAPGPPPLDFVPRASSLPAAVEISPGNRIRTRPGEAMPAVCAREIAADLDGVIDVATLFWRGDLPGRPGHGIVWVRDLGPERNARLLERFRDRQAWFLVPSAADGKPALLPYDEGVARTWAAPRPRA